MNILISSVSVLLCCFVVTTYATIATKTINSTTPRPSVKSTQKLIPPMKDLNVNSTEVKQMTKYAFDRIEMASNSLYIHRLGRILRAQSKIVTGVMYYITFEFLETNCMKNKNTTIGVPCDIMKKEACNVDVWSRPWLKKDPNELVRFSCVKAN